MQQCSVLMQEAHKSLLLVKGQSKLCGKELVETIKFSEEVNKFGNLGSCICNVCKHYADAGVRLLCSHWNRAVT